MEPRDDTGDLNQEDEVLLSNRSDGQSDTAADMQKIREQLFNQCFEMEVKLNRGTNQRPCSLAEADQGLADSVGELERIKSFHFNRTLALHRMQMWHAIGDKLKQNDSEAAELKAISDRCMLLSSHIKKLQREIRTLQDDITMLQKKRLEMKQCVHQKMKEIESLKVQKAHPDSEKFKAMLEKGRKNLEDYKKMVVIAQNVFRGILLAYKVNWIADPKLREIALSLEESPIPD
ncbi:centromere protein H [Syngnathoides biaculeatus]|uniref:centromere protein H n=1 Tax=Syngnathoides biaculeatus TaxID=300417 RepID=UPI002ADE6182|nr:centromere protein H [Syngnathoides biaculeatus]